MAESAKIFVKDEVEKKKSVLELSESTLEDGEKVTMKCSDCDKPLVVVWRTRPKERLNNKPLIWNLKAKCCYCGDASFPKKVLGGFHYKGYDEPHPNGNPEDVVPFVNVIDIVYEGENVVFRTEKVK